MSIGQLLEISRRSLQSHQAAMNVTGQNISNAETDGYHRRRVSLEPTSTPDPGLSERKGIDAQGTGVRVENVERIQDRLLQRAGIQTTTGHATARENLRLHESLEAVLGNTDSGLNDQMSGFWNSWDELANDPTSRSARQNVRSRAQSLVSTFHRLDTDLERLKSETETDLKNTVDTINDQLTRLAALNEQIETSKADGTPDLTAQDKRDQLVDELAEKLPISVQDREGEFTIHSNGITLLQGPESTSLEIDNLSSSPTVTFSDSGARFSPTPDDGGELGAQLEMLSTTIGSVRSDLDALAGAIVDHVNNGPTGPEDGHTDGMRADGTATGEFFDSGFTDAGSIRLHQDILDDVENIAAASDGTSSGDNTVALNLASIRSTKILNGNEETPQEFASNLFSDVGTRVRAARQKVQAEGAARDHVMALRKGRSGVSMNEEMTNLVKFQQAFGAAARVVDTARQMSDTLLSVY